MAATASGWRMVRERSQGGVRLPARERTRAHARPAPLSQQVVEETSSAGLRSARAAACAVQAARAHEYVDGVLLTQDLAAPDHLKGVVDRLVPLGRLRLDHFLGHGHEGHEGWEWVRNTPTKT